MVATADVVKFNAFITTKATPTVQFITRKLSLVNFIQMTKAEDLFITRKFEAEVEL